MSNNDWDDFDDEDTTPSQGEDNAMRNLRKAKRADEKRIKELTEQLETFNKAQKEAVIKKVLENKGVSPKAARMIAREFEGDINEEAVANFIDDNADVFGLQVQQQGNPAQTLDRAALRQQDIVTQQALTPDRAEDANMRLNEAQSAEEIIAMIQSGNF